MGLPFARASPVAMSWGEIDIWKNCFPLDWWSPVPAVTTCVYYDCHSLPSNDLKPLPWNTLVSEDLNNATVCFLTTSHKSCFSASTHVPHSALLRGTLVERYGKRGWNPLICSPTELHQQTYQPSKKARSAASSLANDAMPVWHTTWKWFQRRIASQCSTKRLGGFDVVRESGGGHCDSRLSQR